MSKKEAAPEGRELGSSGTVEVRLKVRDWNGLFAQRHKVGPISLSFGRYLISLAFRASLSIWSHKCSQSSDPTQHPCGNRVDPVQ